MKCLKTKSAYATLIDFLDWLSEVKGDSQGVILAFHDKSTGGVMPFMLEVLKQYKMTDGFLGIVKGFVNCSTVASARLENKADTLTLKFLLREGEVQIS